MSAELVGKSLRYILSLAVHVAIFALVVHVLAWLFDVELEYFWAMLVGVALGDVLSPFVKKGLRRLFAARAA